MQFALPDGVTEEQYTVKVKGVDNEGNAVFVTITVTVSPNKRAYYLTDHLRDHRSQTKVMARSEQLLTRMAR